MGCRVRCLLAGLTALGVLGLVTPALGDSIAPPRSYKKVAPGGMFVFVMISPLPLAQDVKRWNEETAAGIREVRQTYTRSGMYRNDGSAEPLWTVDWYSHGVDLAPDGVHLIRPGPWATLREDDTPDLDVEAVSFFANGRLLHTYRVGELVDAYGGFERSVSHYEWQQEGRLSGEFEYTIATLDGNRFIFDVRTGEIILASRAGLLSRWGWWLALGVAAGAAGVWFVLRWVRRTSINRRRSGPVDSFRQDS